MNTIDDCRYCSVISKANGEDPLGTAEFYHHWFIFEVPRPWGDALWDYPPLEYLMKISSKLILQKGEIIKVVMVAPDKEYSQEGETRVIHYYHPKRKFAEFEKQEYILPNLDKVISLLDAILYHPKKLDKFNIYSQNTKHIREMIVCTHTKVDLACGRFGTPIYRKLRQDYASKANGNIRVWQSSHFGGHQFAPTLIDLPTGRLWGHLDDDILDSLIWHHDSGQEQLLKQLRPYYRGWTGWGKWLQITEGEIWLNESLLGKGCEWLNYYKKGQIIEVGGIGIKKYLVSILNTILNFIPSQRIQIICDRLIKKATWVKVRIKFTAPDGSRSGEYRAKVIENGKVMSAKDSASSRNDKLHLKPVKQYQVTNLKLKVKGKG
ncbi:MAG: sucrase ferredoxin [Cyanobacteria bacterium P01_A01_bin.84]